MRIGYLAVLLLIGCASNQEPKTIATTAYAPMTRHITSKNDLLYTYRIGLNYSNGYEKAMDNAAEWCAKHKLGVIERLQPQCGVYKDQPTLCTVAFKCQ